jgi:hypothetical protein
MLESYNAWKWRLELENNQEGNERLWQSNFYSTMGCQQGNNFYSLSQKKKVAINTMCDPQVPKFVFEGMGHCHLPMVPCIR